MKKILMAMIAATSVVVAKAEDKSKSQVVELSVTEKGFEPNSIDVGPGKTVILKITRKTDSTCATEIQIPAKKIKKDLPLNKDVSIDLGKLEKGEIRFGCGMNMMEGGRIIVK
ncbi:MAG TPA: cupredoxin domain-containing protein [Pseudobdellovibrionaceae bacterium]|jgi:plastocyanin domain-containing protein